MLQILDEILLHHSTGIPGIVLLRRIELERPYGLLLLLFLPVESSWATHVVAFETVKFVRASLVWRGWQWHLCVCL